VIRRVRLNDGIAFCVETAHLPWERVPGLCANDLVLEPSLYTLLSQRFKIKMGQGSSTISMSTAMVGEADLLKLKKDSTCLVLRALSKDTQDKPIEYLTSIKHPQLVVFETPFTAP